MSLSINIELTKSDPRKKGDSKKSESKKLTAKKPDQQKEEPVAIIEREEDKEDDEQASDEEGEYKGYTPSKIIEPPKMFINPTVEELTDMITQAINQSKYRKPTQS